MAYNSVYVADSDWSSSDDLSTRTHSSPPTSWSSQHTLLFQGVPLGHQNTLPLHRDQVPPGYKFSNPSTQEHPPPNPDPTMHLPTPNYQSTFPPSFGIPPTTPSPTPDHQHETFSDMLRRYPSRPYWASIGTTDSSWTAPTSQIPPSVPQHHQPQPPQATSISTSAPPPPSSTAIPTSPSRPPATPKRAASTPLASTRCSRTTSARSKLLFNLHYNRHQFCQLRYLHLNLQNHRYHQPLVHVPIIPRPDATSHHFHASGKEDLALALCGAPDIIHLIGDLPLENYDLLHDIADIPLLHAILPSDMTEFILHIPNTAVPQVQIADVLLDAHRTIKPTQSDVHRHLHHRTLSTTRALQPIVPSVMTNSQFDLHPTRVPFIHLLTMTTTPPLQHHHQIIHHNVTFHHKTTLSFLQPVSPLEIPIAHPTTLTMTNHNKFQTTRNLIAGSRTTSMQRTIQPESKQPQNSPSPTNGTSWTP